MKSHGFYNLSYAYNTTNTELYWFMKTRQLIFLFVVFFLIVVLNSAVIFAITFRKPRGATQVSYFMKHLAFADLCVGLFNVLPDIIIKLTYPVWYGGVFTCKAVAYMVATSIASSNYIIVALTFDRYCAISRPMDFTRNGRRARVVVGVAWAASLALCSPILILKRFEASGIDESCYIQFVTLDQWKIYVIVNSMVFICAPAFLIILFYALILRILWKHGQFVKPAFVICWSPFCIFNLLDIFGQLKPSSATEAMRVFFQSLVPLNSIVNPLIYSFYSNKLYKSLPCLKNFFSTSCRCYDRNNSSRRDTRSTIVTVTPQTGICHELEKILITAVIR